MKKYFTLLIAVLFFTSCGSFRLFPVKVDPSYSVSSDKIPAYISSAFESSYPNIVPEQWFCKHNETYIARFMRNGVTTYAIYTKSGLFDEEEIYDPDYDEFYEDDDIYNWDYGDTYY